MALFGPPSDAQWRWLEQMLQRIDTNVSYIKSTLKRMEMEMSALDDALTALETQVQSNTDAEASAVALLQQLAALIQSNANDPTKVQELATKLKASADALGAAIIANTPSA